MQAALPGMPAGNGCAAGKTAGAAAFVSAAALRILLAFLQGFCYDNKRRIPLGSRDPYGGLSKWS